MNGYTTNLGRWKIFARRGRPCYRTLMVPARRWSRSMAARWRLVVPHLYFWKSAEVAAEHRIPR